MIVVDTQKLYYILDHTPASQNIMLVGRHGIGKSQVLTQYYQQQGYRVVSLFLGQMADPGDLIGLPVLNNATAQGQANGFSTTTYAPPFWYPTDGQPIVLFLDELNRARPEILQTVMDLALNRCLAGHRLPAGSRIISAINQGDEYQLTHLDPALISRFNVYHFCPTPQEWLLWAEANGLDRRVISFIQNEPTLLDGTPELKPGEDTGLEKYPDRRAWHRVSELLHYNGPNGTKQPRLQLVDADLDLIAGVVGAQAASRFNAFLQGRQMLTGAQVLNDFTQCETQLRSYRLHQMAIVNESIFRHLQTEGLCATPEASDELRQAQIQRYSANFTAYYQFLVTTQQNEAIAHLVNIFQNGSYEQAILFITTYCPDIFQQMLTFITNL